jgi:hypothetical protein
MTTLSVASKPLACQSSLAPLLARLPGLIPDRWLILLFSDAANEPVIARYGRVEIRETEGGSLAQTRVKGDREQALRTGLQRLRQFLCRNCRSGIELRLRRPLVQSEEAPGRWLVRIGLSGVDGDIISPASRGGRVKIYPASSETVAVLRVPGRARANSIEHAVVTILGAIAATPWMAIGEPQVRLHGLLSGVPFAGRFEVAVPVAGWREDVKKR